MNSVVTPIPFTWPLGGVFLVALIWSYLPEARVIRAAGRAQRDKDRALRDPSYRPLLRGQQILIIVAVLLAFLAPSLTMRALHSYCTHRDCCRFCCR